MDELKACPFCGAELDKHGCLTRNGVVTDYYIHPAPDEVRDDECPLCGCVFRAATWNRRPLEDALQAEIERLRDAQRWIPVSEEPDPSTCTDVYETEYAWTGRYWTRFLLDDNVFFGPGEYDFNRGLWFSIDMRGSEIDLAVTHYMPLPQPPQEAKGN